MPEGRSPTRVTPRKRLRNSRCRDLRQGVEVGVIGRPSVKARMRTLAVVEVQIPADRGARLADAVVGPQIDLFVFDRAPEPLDKHVVAPRPLAVHADRDGVVEQQAGVKSWPVNWLPWSVLKISGLPCRASASSTASRQNATSIVIDTRHARTRRLNQSTTAAR